MDTIQRITQGKISDIGFPVRRLIPHGRVRHVGPFIFLDHMGPAYFADHTTEGDVRPHPHIGLATLTYLFSGAIQHRDSLGYTQRIEPGAVNLMTAGRGIVHSERMPEDIRAQGIAVEGIQFWLALSEAEECGEARFQHFATEELPVWKAPHTEIHLLIGSSWGLESPVEFGLPAFCAAAILDAGSQFALPQQEELAVYVLSGQVTINGETIEPGQLAVLNTEVPLVTTCNTPSQVMILGGQALTRPCLIDWNFAASRQELIDEAKAKWVAGLFPSLTGETEFIPYPSKAPSGTQPAE